MASQSQKRLALAIIDFLNSSLKDGTLNAEDGDSIDIATSCIAEAFHVDPQNKAAMADAIGTQNLQQIYGVYEKLRGKSTPSTAGESSAKEARPASPQTPGATGPSPHSREEAEKLKAQGNAAMQKKDYSSAIDFYTKALDLVPLNPIYLSNRAAAYSGSGKHEQAKEDAEMAVAADPKYTKAWSRLGLAKFALGDAKGSMEAYKQGIEAEGNGGSEAMKKGYETAKRRVEEEGGDIDDDDTPAPGSRGMPGGGGMPDLSSLASMLGGGGGAGGAGGAGGMPDIGSLMQNPMMRQMAQNLMSNPDALSGLMNNPRLRQMAESFGQGGGGGMPDLAGLMQDPNMQEMARNFMGGMGRGGAGGAGGR